MNELLKIAGKEMQTIVNEMASFSPSDSSASQGALTRGYLGSSDRTGLYDRNMLGTYSTQLHVKYVLPNETKQLQ